MTDRLNDIAPLWADPKMSATKIASALGLSKGMVVGAVYKARMRGDPRFPERGTPIRLRKREDDAMPLPPLDDSPSIFDMMNARRPAEGLIPFLALRPNDCRFPTRSGERRGEHLFCGAPKDWQSESYCKAHHFVCLRPLGVKLHQHAGAL